MNNYEYTLTFSLPDKGSNPEDFLDNLFEAGCDDALVGIGFAGSISLNFIRKEESAAKAVHQSIAQVQSAIPGSELIELKPDLVGISDIAELLECSRQNIRKFTVDAQSQFPRPSVSGSVPLWHFYEVGNWLLKKPRVKLKPRDELIEVSKIAFQKNIAAQNNRYNKAVLEESAGKTKI